MERSGACIEDLWEFGFEGKELFDEEEKEVYYDLYLDGTKIGFTEINKEKGDLEIICESDEDRDKVVKVVGETIKVIPWY